MSVTSHIQMSKSFLYLAQNWPNAIAGEQQQGLSFTPIYCLLSSSWKAETLWMTIHTFLWGLKVSNWPVWLLSAEKPIKIKKENPNAFDFIFSETVQVLSGLVTFFYPHFRRTGVFKSSAAAVRQAKYSSHISVPFSYDLGSFCFLEFWGPSGCGCLLVPGLFGALLWVEKVGGWFYLVPSCSTQ